MKRLMVAACAAAFLALTASSPAFAQEQAPQKKLSAQQQKMKDCAAKWKDEKAKTGVKGREAYRKFLSACLKS